MEKSELFYTFEHIHQHIYISVALLYALKHTHIRPRVPGDNAPRICAQVSFSKCTSHFVSPIGRQPYIIIIHSFIQAEDCGRPWGKGGGANEDYEGRWDNLHHPRSYICMSCIGRETHPGLLCDRRALYHWATDAHTTLLKTSSWLVAVLWPHRPVLVLSRSTICFYNALIGAGQVQCSCLWRTRHSHDPTTIPTCTWLSLRVLFVRYKSTPKDNVTGYNYIFFSPQSV